LKARIDNYLEGEVPEHGSDVGLFKLAAKVVAAIKFSSS